MSRRRSAQQQAKEDGHADQHRAGRQEVPWRQCVPSAAPRVPGHGGTCSRPRPRRFWVGRLRPWSEAAPLRIRSPVRRARHDDPPKQAGCPDNRAKSVPPSSRKRTRPPRSDRKATGTVTDAGPAHPLRSSIGVGAPDRRVRAAFGRRNADGRRTVRTTGRRLRSKGRRSDAAEIGRGRGNWRAADADERALRAATGIAESSVLRRLLELGIDAERAMAQPTSRVSSASMHGERLIMHRRPVSRKRTPARPPDDSCSLLVDGAKAAPRATCVWRHEPWHEGCSTLV